MKKQYIIPTIEIIDVNMEQQLLAGSAPALGGELGGEDPILSPEFAEDVDLSIFE